MTVHPLQHILKEKGYKLILSSNSPRRQELIKGLGIDYTVKTIPDVDESFPAHLTGEDIPLYISRSKADAYKKHILPDELIITADTIVWADGKVLGKPSDAEDAFRMLRELSGKTHQVFTGVCLTACEWQTCFSAATEVTFAELSDQEIMYYVENYKPFDKAGAYGVQEWIGYIGVQGISGSYYNVMGLPIQKLYRVLKEL